MIILSVQKCVHLDRLLREIRRHAKYPRRLLLDSCELNHWNQLKPRWKRQKLAEARYTQGNDGEMKTVKQFNKGLESKFPVWKTTPEEGRSVLWPERCDYSSYNEYKKLLATVVEGDQKAPFSMATTPWCRVGRYFFPWIAPLYTYLILLSVKQGGIKYHFFKSLWYDATWDWTQVSRTIGEHSTHYANEPVQWV